MKGCCGAFDTAPCRAPREGSFCRTCNASAGCVENLEANTAPGTFPVLEALYAPGTPLYNLTGHMNTSSLCRRNSDCRIIYPTPGDSALLAIEADTNFGANPLTAVPSLGVSAAQGAFDIFEAAYNIDITGHLMGDLAAATSDPFNELPTVAQEAIADYAWHLDGGYQSGTALEYYENGDFVQLAELMASDGAQEAKDAKKSDDLINNGQLPTNLNEKALC